MKNPLISALLALAVSGPALADDLQEKYLKDSRETAQEFMLKLGTMLKQQIEVGGAENAIGVCKQYAPALAAEYSGDNRAVKRVSLKPRNPALGTPDTWEKQMLESFDNELSGGKPIASMEKNTVVETPDGRWFRYMKAIPTQPMCLQCHGQPYQISDGVKALLAKDYPDDQATGYSAGSIRGAVSIKWKMN
ncbi:MAG TPA: DUF3365 domain-containing protein [Methylophilaceae bacterium]|nr:DUF3365 domain-containing protein [Methylophilaceae bacterium]HQR60369.1 DUF3365 domain-containing protein [Methylophilaceae bacterium]